MSNLNFFPASFVVKCYLAMHTKCDPIHVTTSTCSCFLCGRWYQQTSWERRYPPISMLVYVYELIRAWCQTLAGSPFQSRSCAAQHQAHVERKVWTARWMMGTPVSLTIPSYHIRIYPSTVTLRSIIEQCVSTPHCSCLVSLTLCPA